MIETIEYPWELIANDLSEAGWSWGYFSFITPEGKTRFCVDAHRGDEKRYIVHADKLLAAFIELEEQTKRAA